MDLSKGFKAFVTVAFAVVFAVAPAVVAPQLALADAPELTFADITGDDVTSDPNGITVSFESDQDGYIIYTGVCVSDTIEAVDGENSVTFMNVPENVYAEGDCQIRVFNEDGEISDPLDVPAFTVDATAPKLAIVERIDTPTSSASPTIDISLSEDADELVYGGACSSATTSAGAGTVTLTLRDAETEDPFDSGTFNDCTITAVDEAGNESEELDIPAFEVILTGDIFIIQTGNVETPTGSLADDSTRVITVNVSHDGELYDGGGTLPCIPYPNTVTAGSNQIHLSLDSDDYSGDAGTICILDYVVELATTENLVELGVGEGSFSDLPDLTAADSVAPDIDESEATFVDQDAGSTAGFRFTVDEGGTWAIIDDADETGTCSVALTGATILDDTVHPGVNTVIFDTATGSGLVNGTSYGASPDGCEIEVTDISGNASSVDMPQFTVNDNEGPTLEIVKDIVSPVASGGTAVLRFSSNEYLAGTLFNTEVEVDLDGDCFDTEENTAWDFLTDFTVDSENASGDIEVMDQGTNVSVYNELSIANMDDGTYSNCKVRFTDANGNASTTLNIPEFSIGQAGPELEDPSYQSGTVENLVTVEFTSDRAGTFNISSGPCTVEGYQSELPLESGDNSVTFDNLAAGATTCEITGYDEQGRVGNTLTFGPFTVDDDGNPGLEVVSAVNPSTLSFTFSSETGGDITYEGFCSSTTLRAVPGNNTIMFNPLPEGLLVDNCEVTVTSNDDDDTLNVAPFTSEGEAPLTGAEGTVWRFWNPTTLAHFYTADPAEANYVRDENPNWTYEAAVFMGYVYDADASACTEGTEVFRFYNPTVGVHFYTADAAERDYIIDTNPNWDYEAVAYCAQAEMAEGLVPMYQFWSDARQAHFYTIDDAEKAYVETDLGDIYRYEGIVFYVMTLN